MAENANGIHTTKRPSLAVALIPMITMGLLLGIGYGIYHIRPQVLLVAAAFLTGCLGMILKFKWQDMERGIVDSIHKAMPAILIMLCVGILIGSWIASGTIPMVIYYGLKLISPKFFLVTACFVCSLTSIATGTSWGTIGTRGVAFIGISMGLGIRRGPAAGPTRCRLPAAARPDDHAAEVHLPDRPRVVSSLKLSHIQPMLGALGGLKGVLYGEVHRLPSGEREERPGVFEDVAGENGVVIDAQVGLFTGVRDTFVNVFFRHATGLAREHDPPLLERKHRGLDRAVPVKQWLRRVPGCWPQLLAALRQAFGEVDGSKDFIAALNLVSRHGIDEVTRAVERTIASGCVSLPVIRYHLGLNAESEKTRVRPIAYTGPGVRQGPAAAYMEVLHG